MLWIAKDDNVRGYIQLFSVEPQKNSEGCFETDQMVGLINRIDYFPTMLLAPGEKKRIFLGSPPLQSTADAIAVLSEAAKRLPDGTDLDVTFFGDGRTTIYSHQNNNHVPHESFDEAIEKAIEWSKPKPPALPWIIRPSEQFVMIYTGTNAAMPLDLSIAPDIPVGHKCQIEWDRSGIRLIGEPQKIGGV